MTIEGQIRVIVASDQEHEKLVVEIHHADKFVMLLSCESGVAMVEIPGPVFNESAVTRAVPLRILERGLEIAKERMAEIRYD